jgi:threonine 3-dehydrogenase
MERILVTGALGQIGSELVPKLAKKYTVVSSDIREPQDPSKYDVFEKLDVTNIKNLENVITTHKIDTVIHNAAILSATGEKNPQLAIQVNINGLNNIFEVSRNLKLSKILVPSSIAIFGPTTPKINTPNETIMRPTTIYGISKVYSELLGEYYHQKYGLDIRSLRYPGIISADTLPGGGTTDWAVEIFYEILKGNIYKCFVHENTRMPMMSIQDCLRSTIELLEVEETKLIHRSFNVSGIDFTPKELVKEISNQYGEINVVYEPDFRQDIANSWPQSIDDSLASQEWGWKAEYDLEKLTSYMIKTLTKRIIE